MEVFEFRTSREFPRLTAGLIKLIATDDHAKR